MERVDIKDISGSIRFSTIVNEGSKRKFLLMKEDYVTVKFNWDEPIFFKLGDYIDDGHLGVFEICDIQKPAYNAITASYDYELRLDAYYWKWKNKIFKYTPETAGQEASWNLTAPLDVQVGIVLRNLKALGYVYKGQDFEFSIDSTVENKAQLMSYDNINILDACFEMAKKWDCECWVTENIIHFGRCEFGTAVDFEIAKNVVEMTRSESQSTYSTRIYAFGSTRNIPTNYRPVDESVVVNGVVQRRLMLPAGTPYIDAYPNMTTEEAIEQVVIFDEVYPRRVGTMSDITTKEYTETIENADGTITEKKWNAYRFKDTGITFSKDYVLPSEELKITFQSGKLNGMMFAVTFDPDGKDEQLWEIVRNEDYGRPLPDGVLVPENGGTYVLSGWDSTKITELGLVSSAEQELKAETEKYVAKSKIDPNTYNCKMMSDDAYREDSIHNLYGIGQKVNLINKAYFENGRQSRIIGFEFNLDYPFDSPVYTVGETAAYSRIGELEEKIENITLAGQAYTGGGGSGVYVIRRNDSTPATDSNVYSALRSLKMFLRKDQNDSTNYLLTMFAGALFGNFSEGPLGSGACVKIDPITGKSYIEVDELFVRIKAYFTELIIATLRHVGGNYILTPASMKCIKVEELADVYRCYFKKTDGDRTIHNEFVAGDQATIREFNIEPGVHENVGNRHYWRLVTAIGDDYIDLSKTDCDTNSDAPEAGDDICQLGNRNDRSRMNAIILSSYGDDAPSSKQYAGIDSYSLEGKEVTVESPSGNRYVGDFVLETGISIATQLKVLENLIKTEIQNVEYWINDEDNYLRNASFSLNLENWQRESDLQVLTAEQPLVVNSEYYADATKIAEVVNHGDKFMLRIKNSFVKQLNSDLDHPEKSGKFYVSFRYICEGSGTLTCGFEGQELYKAAPIAINRQFRIFEFSGDWDGSGDFLLRFTGDIYINLLTLTNRPLDDFRKEVSSKFEQTSSSITAAVKAIDNINKTIRESGWLTTQDGTKIWASAQWPDGTKALSLFNVTPEGIFLDGSHINLKGLVTFESFSADFQTAYNQAFGNASMTAKDDVARQLGYNNYSQLVENAATNGKAIMIGGYLNLELIDVDTLLANKVFSNKVVTSLAGKRIEIDPAKNAIVMYNQGEEKVAELYFFDEEGHDYSQGYLQLISYRSNKEVGKAVIGAHSIGLMLSDGGVVNLSERGVEVNRLIGNNWKTLSVGLYPLMTGGTVSDYITNISSNSWPTKDNALPNSIYVENGILKVK